MHFLSLEERTAISDHTREKDMSIWWCHVSTHINAMCVYTH